MDKIRRKPLSPYSNVSSGSDTEMPTPQQLLDSLGPDAFGNKEPEEGARELHKKLTDFADQSPELSPELVSEEAPEAFFLGAESKLKDVEADLTREDSTATYDEKVDFSKGVDIIHLLFSGEEIPTYNPTYQPPDEEELRQELERKIAKVKKEFGSGQQDQQQPD